MPQLDESASVVLSASGAGSLTIGPTTPRTRWKITNAAVSGTSSADTTANLYLGPASPANLIGGTYSGNQDSIGIDLELFPGQILTAVWTGGTAGARQTLSIYGSFDVAR